MKLTLKILIGLLALIALAVIAVAVFISPVTKKYIEEHDHELIGRSIRMDGLRMNIFTGRVRVEGLCVGGVDDSTTFFRVDSFDMRLKLLPLLKNRIDVPYVTFAGPDVKVYQRGMEFNFDGLLDRFLSDSTEVEETPSEPWDIAINNIVIRRGHLFYKDLELNAVWGLNDIDLVIPGVHFSGEKTDVGAVLNFAEGGSLATQVAYDMERSAFDIGVKLRNLTLPGTLPYFQQTLNVTAVEGLLSADMNLHGDVEHLLSVRADGTAELSGFKLYDQQSRPVIGIDTLAMNLAEGDLGRMKFRFERLYVGGFSTFAELTENGNNLTDLMKPDAPADPATTATTGEEQAATPDLAFSVADMEIANSRITLRDLTLQQPFEYQISDIRMRSKNFDPEAKNNLMIDAQMQKTGHAKLLWEGTLDDINNQNITLMLTNVALKDFTPYCEHYTAYPLTQGNLTFRSQNVIRNRYLDGTNHLDVFEPKVEKKRKDLKPEMNIPLKLGLYVLKDKKGHVKMDLPVKGSLDSPEFSYRKIILKAIGNVLLKVATAPFSFLGGSKDDLEYINIDACQYAFSSEQYALFDRIAQMIQEKPEMHIALTQRINLTQAVPRQAADVLRMAYAQHQRTADSLAQRPAMSMLEFEKIQQIDIRRPEVVAFADSLLLQNGMISRGSPADKAKALYGKEAAQQLRRMMAARNKSLSDYMQRTHNLTAPAFRLQPADSVELQAYAGRDRYTIGLEAEGENLQVAQADSTATTGIAQNPEATAMVAQ